MRRSYAKSARGSRKGRSSALASAFKWLLGFSGALFLCWSLLLPTRSGAIGSAISARLFSLLGRGAYLLAPLLLYVLFQYLRRAKGRLLRCLAAATSLACACALLALLAGLFGADSLRAGGSLGRQLSGLLTAGVGTAGALLLTAALLALGLQAAFGIRWFSLLSNLSRLLAADYRDWRAASRELSTRIEAASPKPEPKAEARPEAGLAQAKPAAPPVQKIEPEPSLPPRPRSAPSPRTAAPKDSKLARYDPPPLSLLNPIPAADNRGKPTEAEIRSAIASLETTLRNFGIDARVCGYAPGPVITRYELSPAPGVKVSSIVALENDLALALRAKGIRIIAPIPGKAAVGIEIPNARPALVTLRELLESGTLPPEAPLLTFGLGLAADGQPRTADIQRMPHVLVAGATNSGKSVAIHAMILSILFRARPDEVKFLMIDPKRLELTFYDGIPHLFDPTQPPDKVAVATSPKDAAKSLQALVRLMERRYEKFQLFGVRNIDSYNREADKRGQPREFFILVVIDELADLMLVASDSVEDSIQRLTQMARAVGIHMVLATQRPSVDVITGVIKANLPARLALQVISKVDSKVILDCTGAETLQGRGDLLYLAAGAQKPERCQGAYVGEDEINRVTAYLKTQGKPDYPMLETMAAKNGAAEDLAALGVEPLEFSQALKLVLERRRVSQDLLKSQFGSSARATNLLSALEVKELIHKPEGSNRWEIHFDQIEDYLREHFPQVPL
ncbi:MAG: DNA translocase FtsK [Elusimicrobia bacterium]|nr:DNA translocase FtsK [Elusimicrobiota bacterium]MDE2425565.1 DNA translocase FtsK [Elusimicrobiota bacterium]